MMDCTPFCYAHRYSVCGPHLLRPSPLFPSFFIAFILRLPPPPLPFTLCLFCLGFVLHPFLFFIFYRGHVCLTMKGRGGNLFPSILPLQYPSLLPHVPSPPPRGRAVMCNQRDRAFHRDKVNRTMRGLTKLLTPRQLNMNKRCARCVCVFFPRRCTTPEHF